MKLVLILILTALYSFVYCQNKAIGFYLENNVSWLNASSKSTIESRPHYYPGYGKGIGVKSLFKINNRYSFSVGVGCIFSSYVNNSGITMSNVYNQPMGTSGFVYITNLNFQINTIHYYKISETYSIGCGINYNHLIISKALINSEFYFSSKGFIKNPIVDMAYYNPNMISIPISIKYNIRKCEIYFQFNKGLTDKVKGRENLIKLRDNSISAGFCYYFF